MSTKTKIEQSSLQQLAKQSMDTVSVTFEKQTIDKTMFAKLSRYFNSKTLKRIVEEAFYFTASGLIKPGKDLLDHFSLDKSSTIVQSLQKKSQNKNGQSTKADVVNIKVPLWQVMVIASDVDKQIQSEGELVESCVRVTCERLSVLFGESL